MENQYEKSVIPLIEAVYSSFTTVERNIADFFIHNREEMDFSSKNISKLLYVSEASLSRFAKRCGFKGYREFIFNYQNAFKEPGKQIDELTKTVLNTYQELLNKSFALVDEAQMHRIAKMLTTSHRVFVYGMGSSGMAAQEFKMRFMRLGLFVESINDSHIMRMNSALLREDDLVIGISISGKTEEIISGLRKAKERGSSTILITANNREGYHAFCDEILLVAVKKNLDAGNVISPQFPVLVMVDIFYSFFLNTDLFNRSALHSNTVSALQMKQEPMKRPKGN
jgi:DNA-binding MurR/RpiR family transcriptional regulator